MIKFTTTVPKFGTTMLLASRTFFEAIVGMALKKQGITDPWYIHPHLIADK